MFWEVTNRTMNSFTRAKGSTLNLPRNKTRAFPTLEWSDSGATRCISCAYLSRCTSLRIFGPVGSACVKARSRIDTCHKVPGEKQRGAVSTSRTCSAVHSRKRERACVLRQNILIINANRKRRCEELNLSEEIVQFFFHKESKTR